MRERFGSCTGVLDPLRSWHISNFVLFLYTCQNLNGLVFLCTGPKLLGPLKPDRVAICDMIYTLNCGMRIIKNKIKIYVFLGYQSCNPIRPKSFSNLQLDLTFENSNLLAWSSLTRWRCHGWQRLRLLNEKP